MNPVISLSIRVAWAAVGLVWLVTAMKLKRAIRVESRESQVGHQLTIALALALLFSSSLDIGWLAWRAIPDASLPSTVGVALTIAGAGFAIWARLNLGGNWSARVTIKEEHTLQRTGPYAVVRHPIYAGLFLAMVGSAIAFGQVRCFLGAVVAFAAWLAKARLEESFLLARFGDAYATYRREVKILIPFVL